MFARLRPWRFLLSRRWVLFFLTIVLVGLATWWLGRWQFGRLQDKKELNAIIRANEHRDPAPVATVLDPGGTVPEESQWRTVTATGEYDAADTVVVRYRTNDEGDPGVDVVVPLITRNGTALLVDRGWYATDDPGIDPAEVPAPPSGTVTVTGWVRQDGSGDSTKVTDHSTRAISSSAIADAIDKEVYGGFVQLRSEDPKAAHPLVPADPPDLGNGPHFFYGIQWWFFGVLAAAGFGYLAWDERNNGNRAERRRAAAAAADAEAERGRRAGQSPGESPEQGPGQGARQGSGRTADRPTDQSARVMPPSTGTMAPETNDAAGESRNAATRPNSAGAP